MRILIVDGSERVRETLIKYLELETLFDLVLEAGSVQDAERIMQSIIIEVVLLDIQLPDKSGLDFVDFCNKQYYKPMIIVCSNYGLPQYKSIYEKLSIKHFDKSSELLELKRFFKRLTQNNRKNICRLPAYKRKTV